MVLWTVHMVIVTFSVTLIRYLMKDPNLFRFHLNWDQIRDFNKPHSLPNAPFIITFVADFLLVIKYRDIYFGALV